MSLENSVAALARYMQLLEEKLARVEKAAALLGTFSEIELSIATGTKPLTVTSTTMCTNLNADTVDGQHAADLGGGGGGASVLEVQVFS